MPKKQQHAAILAIDPSFRGLGVAFHHAGCDYSYVGCFDICQDLKGFSKYTIVVRLVAAFLDELFELLDPFIWDTTVLVIESQFKKALERLQDAIVNQLYCRLAGKLKLLPVAAYTWREFFSLGDTTYNKRKKRSVQYVAVNRQLLCWEPDLSDDNMCEAILLLNFALRKHSLALAEPKLHPCPMSSSHTCPVCGNACTLKVSQSEKNTNRPYWACTNRGCAKNGFTCWQGEESGSKKYPAKKRPTLEGVAPPPTPKRTAQAPVAAPSADTLLKEIINIKKDNAEGFNDVLAVLEQTNKLLYIIANGKPSYAPEDEEAQEGGVTDFYCDEPPL